MDFPIIGVAKTKERSQFGYGIVEEIFIMSENEKVKFLERNAPHNVTFRELNKKERLRFIEIQKKNIHRPDKPVRISIIKEYEKGFTREIKIVTWSEYLSMKKYKSYGQSVELYPYKWYEKIYERPAQLVYRLFSKNSLLIARKHTQILIKIAIVLVEFTVTYYFGKLVLDKI